MSTRIVLRKVNSQLPKPSLTQNVQSPTRKYYLKPDEKKSTWQRYAKWGCVGTAAGFSVGVLTLGTNWDGLEDEYSDMSLGKAIIARAYGTVSEQLSEVFFGKGEEALLPDTLPYPYQAPYTLVLELSDLLVACEYTRLQGWRYKKRQGIDVFLENVCQYYEVVIFTKDEALGASSIIQALDPKMCILYKLYKDSLTHEKGGGTVKDISRLNRDLSKVIMVDVDRQAVSRQTENALVLPKWRGEDDLDLLDLADMLIVIAKEERPKDIRTAIQTYTGLEDPIGAYKLRKREILDMQRKRKAERIAQQSNSIFAGKKWW